MSTWTLRVSGFRTCGDSSEGLGCSDYHHRDINPWKGLDVYSVIDRRKIPGYADKRRFSLGTVASHPEGPCTQIVYTLAPKYLYRDYIKAKVSTIWVHGPVYFSKPISDTFHPPPRMR